MDLENQEQVKEFVKNTVKNHQEIQFTSRNFTEEIKKITEGEEFNKLFELNIPLENLIFLMYGL